ncbi:MAG: hypothetical protein AAF465_10580 [Pseudomonadota bacterium]
MIHEHTRFDAITRQYSWLREKGHSHVAAITQLSEKGDSETLAILSKIETIVRSESSTDEFLALQLGDLTQVLDASPAASGDRAAGYLAARSLISDLDRIGATLRTLLLPRFAYLGLVCFVALIVSTIFASSVLPNLQIVYQRSPVDIPDSVISAMGMTGYPLISLLLLALVAGLYGVLHQSTYSLSTLRDFGRPFHRTPGLSRINSALARIVGVGMMRIGSRTGLELEDSYELMRQRINWDDDDFKDALDVAWQTDVIENEIAYQRRSAEEALDSAVQFFVRVVSTILTFSILIMIGAMVIDYYIPILYIGRSLS